MKRNRLMMSKYRLSEAKMYSSGSKAYLKNKMHFNEYFFVNFVINYDVPKSAFERVKVS